MINLSKWLEEHPAQEFTYKGNTYAISGQRYDYREDPTLNELQQAHINGDIDLYKPIEAHKEQWYHDRKTYYPIEGTKRRDDLPPVYLQWKEDHKRRKLNG